MYFKSDIPSQLPTVMVSWALHLYKLHKFDWPLAIANGYSARESPITYTSSALCRLLLFVAGINNASLTSLWALCVLKIQREWQSRRKIMMCALSFQCFRFQTFAEVESQLLALLWFSTVTHRRSLSNAANLHLNSVLMQCKHSQRPARTYAIDNKTMSSTQSLLGLEVLNCIPWCGKKNKTKLQKVEQRWN